MCVFNRVTVDIGIIPFLFTNEECMDRIKVWSSTGHFSLCDNKQYYSSIQHSVLCAGFTDNVQCST